MPLVIIYADEGRTIDQKRGLVKDISYAVYKNFSVGPEAVCILIGKGKKENRAKAGKLAIDSEFSFSSDSTAASLIYQHSIFHVDYVY